MGKKSINICLISILSFCIVFGLVFVGFSSTVEARDSSTTQRGAGPLYWITYEYQYVNDTYMPEDRWKNNIDWIAQEFLQYGYDMVCTDGWIEGSTRVNSNGYVISHNDTWEHDWEYWVNYCESKGLKMGIYYTPLWVTQEAFNQNCQIIGTNYYIQDIVGSEKFDGGQGTFLYWVDTDKPGAEEFIKGYVNYFKNCGAKFLRVDFLSWYENDYGSSRYEKAIRWMNEECGDDMTLSLVMPNLYNHGENELPNGDMVRIDEDCFNGGWDHISDRRRGQWQEGWSQWGNAFDGFTGWADVTGRGAVIADGDFLRLNTISTNAEKKSAISIFTMAGSPICIADQYNTIGDNSSFYQNTEIIALNQAGLVGKPINYDSERWAGQLPDGSWVVGLFNRDSYTKTKSVDFHNELGINGTASVRDLWEHEDLGDMESYTEDIASHDCRILKIVPNAQKYEAEVASMIGGAKKDDDHLGYSGFGFVDNMENVGAKVRFCIEVDSTSIYNLNIRYANAGGSTRTASLYINGNDVEQIQLPELDDWDSWDNYQVSVSLNEGENIVDIQYDENDTGYFNIDYIEIGTPGPAPEAKPAKYQAENAQLSGGASVNDNHFFYSSTGFVDKMETVGAAVTFNVNVDEAGYYDVKLRYANGNGDDRTLNIYINGNWVKQTTLSTLTGWDEWAEKEDALYLDSGSNTITYKYDSDCSAFVNLDYISLTPHYVRIRSRWNGNSLYQDGDKVTCGNIANTEQSSHWFMENSEDGYIRIKNRVSGQYMNIENEKNYVECTPIESDWHSARWVIEEYDGHKRIRNCWKTDNYIHIEDNTGYAQYGTVDDSWYSAQWWLEDVD